MADKLRPRIEDTWRKAALRVGCQDQGEEKVHEKFTKGF